MLVFNRNDKPFALEGGMRIAQIVFQRAIIPDFSLVAQFDQLEGSERGSGGFGSTGLR